MQKRWILLCACASLFAACIGETKTEHYEYSIGQEELRDPSVKVNKKHNRFEKEQIDAYVERHGWDMLETGTGVRILVYKKGTGPVAESGNIVMLEFTVKLLDGTLCYSSLETGAEEFRVDFDNVESGLHEAMKYLHEGDKAIVIIPSYRAFGLLGDMSKIPPLSAVVYNLSIVSVQGESGRTAI